VIGSYLGEWGKHLTRVLFVMPCSVSHSLNVSFA
jgi:hypothetical protein